MNARRVTDGRYGVNAVALGRMVHAGGGDDEEPRGTPTLATLDRDMPSLDKKNAKVWAKPGDLKAHKETPSTDSLRSQRSRGTKTDDGSFGVCQAGRIWRKDGRDTWYYVPSLLPVRDKHEPLIAAALRLISTVD